MKTHNQKPCNHILATIIVNGPIQERILFVLDINDRKRDILEGKVIAKPSESIWIVRVADEFWVGELLRARWCSIPNYTAALVVASDLMGGD